MSTHINDLPELTDILDTMKMPESTITDQDLEDIRESIQLIIEKYMEDNILAYRYENFPIKLYRHIYNVLENIELISDINVDDFINEGIYLYMNLIIIPRSIDNPATISPRNRRDVSQRLKALREKEQPEQRTEPWYIFRHDHITASSAWKAFESEKTKNQLLYDKCLPLHKKKKHGINVTSATHHGNKYEPLSTRIYEIENKTEIEEFGCLEHDSIPFIAASPDGINVNPTSKKYGRLLEIKNPVSREIKGIPKKEYWVQMQMQMYVTELYVCDFLETLFKEYENEEAFLADGTFMRTKENKRKGIIVCFNGKKGPIYKYPPVNIDKDECEAWIDETINNNPTLSWIQNSYWRLETYSCVAVRFNPEWFTKALPILTETWEKICDFRKTGFAHLKPTTRKRKPKIYPATILQQLHSNMNSNIIKVETEIFNSTKVIVCNNN